MKEYIVLSNLRHDGQVYRKDDVIKLSAELHGNKLVADGVLKEKGAKVEDEIELKPRVKKEDKSEEKKDESTEENKPAETDETPEAETAPSEEKYLEDMSRDELIELIKTENVEIEVKPRTSIKALIEAIKANRQKDSDQL